MIDSPASGAGVAHQHPAGTPAPEAIPSARTLQEILDVRERRLLVDWLLELARCAESEDADPIEEEGLYVLVEAHDVARWAVAFGLEGVHAERASILSSALAVEPEAVEAIARNAVRYHRGEPVLRWTLADPPVAPGTLDRLRARATCDTVRDGAWREGAPVERHEDTRRRQAAEREAAVAEARARAHEAAARVRAKISGAGDGWAYAALLREDPAAREILAERLGAPVVRGRVKTATCPACARPSVCFSIVPSPRWKGALCSHRNSCGWGGSVWDLAAAHGLDAP